MPHIFPLRNSIALLVGVDERDMGLFILAGFWKHPPDVEHSKHFPIFISKLISQLTASCHPSVTTSVNLCQFFSVISRKKIKNCPDTLFSKIAM